MVSSGFIITLEDQPVSANSSSQKRNDTVADQEFTKRAIRDYRRIPIDNCLFPSSRRYIKFNSSYCAARTLGAGYTLFCDKPAPTISQASTYISPYREAFIGSCPSSHVCHQREASTEGAIDTAWCISGDVIAEIVTDAFEQAFRRNTISFEATRHLAITPTLIPARTADQTPDQTPDQTSDKSPRQSLGRTSDVNLSPRKTQNRYGNLEMVLTKPNYQILSIASLITLAAKDANNNTLGQTVSCQDCSRLSFLRWPAGTTHFDSNITLPNLKDRPILHVDGWII